MEKELENDGFYYRPNANIKDQLLFACGSYYEGSGDLQTHFIHVVLKGSMEWINYINFRDYLNKMPDVAKAYEDLKISLVVSVPLVKGREQYLKGKTEFIVYTLRKAFINSYLGKTVEIKIDRPIGIVHRHSDVEDKLVAAPEGINFTQTEIKEAVHF